MTPITPPIFCVTKHDSIELSNSAKHAAGGLEDWYVEDEEPIFFDALARRLKLEGEGLYRLSLPDNPVIDRKTLCDSIAKSTCDYSRGFLGTDTSFYGTAERKFDRMAGLAHIIFLGQIESRPGPTFWNILLGRFKMAKVHRPIFLITGDDRMAGIYPSVSDALESPESAESEPSQLRLYDCLARKVVCSSDTDFHITQSDDLESNRLLLSNAISAKICSYVGSLRETQDLEKLVPLSKRVFLRQFDPE